jgi:group I intron endonuclease
MIGIYKITSPSGKIYIGQSIDIERRFVSYKNLNGVRGQKALQNSFFKHGVDNHIFEILEECSIEELNNLERYYQDLYNVLKDGLNCKLTKSDDKSGVICEKIRKKISNSHLGITPDLKTRLKMSESAKNRPKRNYTKEHKLKISKGNKGKKRTKEQLIKLSKKVIDTETNIIYECVQDAADFLNIKKSTLINYLSGFRKNKTTMKYLN